MDLGPKVLQWKYSSLSPSHIDIFHKAEKTSIVEAKVPKEVDVAVSPVSLIFLNDV